MRANPFFELYVGDRISSREFVTIFSPALVPFIDQLFLPGNIVMKGVQGCGKSMLLSLLKAEVRKEYAAAGEDFPVPRHLRKYICASVNLAHSNVIDFGYRSDTFDDPLRVELLFADFLNYLIVIRLIEAIEAIATSGPEIRKEIGLLADFEALDQVAKHISELTVWEGWVKPCESFTALSDQLKKRVGLYRRFLHGKDLVLDASVFDTATRIGSPIIEVSRLLRERNFIDRDTNLFVDIDQYEELGNISSDPGSAGGVDYRAVINKALSGRSPEVSYRIGTRGYSWSRNKRIHGTSGNLEAMRDYKFVDLDSLLMKDEIDAGRAKSTFNVFAEDVFRRRLKFSMYNFPDGKQFSALDAVYGKEVSSEEKVNRHYGLENPTKFVRCEADWRPSTRARLESLAAKDLFSAKLGESWIRQKGDLVELDSRDEWLPWNSKSKRWWRKERSQAIAMQVASLANQRMIWGGAKDIVELSGGSILIFLGINQFIWDSWLQRGGGQAFAMAQLPQIEIGLQSVAILKASTAWLEMVREQTGNSSSRARFIRVAAENMRRRMLNDRALSYPGGNGFSVLTEELESLPGIAAFIEDLSDFGNMVVLHHTSKERERRARKKIYLHPIFSPWFSLPYARTKEPLYLRVSEIVDWMQDAQVEIDLGNRSRRDLPPQNLELI